MWIATENKHELMLIVFISATYEYNKRRIYINKKRPLVLEHQTVDSIEGSPKGGSANK